MLELRSPTRSISVEVESGVRSLTVCTALTSASGEFQRKECMVNIRLDGTRLLVFLNRTKDRPVNIGPVLCHFENPFLVEDKKQPTVL